MTCLTSTTICRKAANKKETAANSIPQPMRCSGLKQKQVAQFSNRRETALQGELVMAKSGRLELGDNIYGLYRFIFNHCDVFG